MNNFVAHSDNFNPRYLGILFACFNRDVPRRLAYYLNKMSKNHPEVLIGVESFAVDTIGLLHSLDGHLKHMLQVKGIIMPHIELWPWTTLSSGFDDEEILE